MLFVEIFMWVNVAAGVIIMVAGPTSRSSDHALKRAVNLAMTAAFVAAAVIVRAA